MENHRRNSSNAGVERDSRRFYRLRGATKKLIIFAVLVCWFLPIRAGAIEKDRVDQGVTPLEKKGRISLQALSGLAYSPLVGDHRPTLNYSLTALRLGYVLTGIRQQGSVFRGNIEWLSEVVYGPVIKGPGNYLAGVTVLFRYNFLIPDASVIPYVQLGAGIVYNDIYKDESQSLIGQSIEFTPQAALGIHYFADKKWTIDLEAIYHHVSNAGLAERNVGVNALGGLLGMTYYFGKK